MSRPATPAKASRILLIAVLITAWVLPSLADDPAPDLLAGQRVFEANCTVCHGPGAHLIRTRPWCKASA